MSDRATLRGTRILVAGAGLAGLAAARTLEGLGAEVTVADARARVGGRVWTIRDGFRRRQHAEAGADLIDADQNAVLTLAKELGLRARPILKGGFGYCGTDRRGRVCIQSVERGFESLDASLHQLIYRYKLAEERWDGAIARALARQSVADWLRAIQADQWLVSRLRGLRGFFLADPEDLSLIALVDFFATSGFSGGGLLRIDGGNDRLATEAARRLAHPVMVQTVLRRVREHGGRLVASLESPQGLHEFEADYLVAAIPAPHLVDIQWELPVPEAQRRAWSQLRYGPATRLMIQFARRFWKRRGRPSAFGSDQPTGAVWDGNEEQAGPEGILSFLAGGRASRELQQLLQTPELADLLPRLRWLGEPAKVVAFRTFVWEEDPWARGGYAYFDPSFDPAWRDWLARPAGRIVFAGEHTSIRWQGYMNGAVESGQRAAWEIAAMAAV